MRTTWTGAHGLGVYLTDDVFLYRLVGVLPSGTGHVVELEDCYLLDVVRVPVAQLGARRLREVTPARSAEPERKRRGPAVSQGMDSTGSTL